MCGNNLNPQDEVLTPSATPQVGTEPEAHKPGGVADMSGTGLASVAIIEQHLVVLRRKAIHG